MNYTRKEYISQLQQRLKVVEDANEDLQLELVAKDKEIANLTLMKDALGGGMQELRKENERLNSALKELRAELNRAKALEKAAVTMSNMKG